MHENQMILKKFDQIHFAPIIEKKLWYKLHIKKHNTKICM
jgi:hypothetical protein